MPLKGWRGFIHIILLSPSQVYGAIVADVLSGNSIFVKWAKAELLFESYSKPKPTRFSLKASLKLARGAFF